MRGIIVAVNTARSMGHGAHLHPFTSLSSFLNDGPYVLSSAKGLRVHDADGKELIDAAAGLWCVNVGYGREEIVDAVAEQMRRLTFFQAFNGTTTEATAALAERILKLAPKGMRRVFFGNSGSDANDSAVKLIWLFNNLLGRPQKKKIIARKRAYHGVTVAAGSMTGLPGVHRMFDLPLPMFRHVSPPDLYRHPDRDAQFYAGELDALIRTEGADTIAAFVAEPVMGTGGVLVPPSGYYQAIRKVLEEHDVLLVFDEVISGFGRLGRWFGAEFFDVQPDLITVAKGLTSSYLPMSAVVIGERIWSVMEAEREAIGVFGHGFTTSGHPAAAAAGLANLEIIEREGLVERAGQMGALLRSAIDRAVSGHDLVGDIRSCGLMVGVELVADRRSKKSFQPAQQVGAKLARIARDDGLLLRALPANDVIAFSPSFVIDKQTIDQIVSLFSRSLDRVADQLRRE